MSRLLDEALRTGRCPRCNQRKSTIDEQYSFGVYAGVMCRECAIRGYRDACGLLDGQQGDPADLDEPYDPEPDNSGREGW